MNTLDKMWLALVRDSSWTIALLETSSSGMAIQAFREFDMSNSQETDFDVEVMRNWMDLHDADQSRIKIALDCSSVMACFVELPRVSAKTLDKHFKENVSDYFDCAEEVINQDYIVNFKVVSFFELNGHERVRILLAALPKNLLTVIYGIIGQLSMELASINIACECYIRLFEGIVPERFFDIACVDLCNESGHIFLIEKGEIVRYASVRTELIRLFKTLRLWAVPAHKPTGVPLKNLVIESLGFESAENHIPPRGPGQLGDFMDLFPEFAVVTPKIEESNLEALFVERKDLPFLLKISVRDLQRNREHDDLERRLKISREEQTVALFNDVHNAASLEQVFAKLSELIRDYMLRGNNGEQEGQKGEQETEKLTQELEHSFAQLYVTGLGIKEYGFSALLQQAWQELLPVQFGFVEDWKPSVAQPEPLVDDWTKHACLLGLILKSADDAK